MLNLDNLIIEFDKGLRTLFAQAPTARPYPDADIFDAAMTEAFVAFFSNADLVIFDAMYSLADAVSVKADWGHSSNMVGVELCQMAGAKRLCLFHHEPIYSDHRIYKVWRDTRRLEELTREGRQPIEVLSAYDGLEIEL